MNYRKTIRFLLLNANNELLLMRVVDPTTNRIGQNNTNAFWCTTGGSIEENETEMEAIKRELFEETGLTLNDVELGPFVWHGKHTMYIRNTKTILDEKFIVINTNNDKISTSNFTQNEKEVITNLSWLSLDEILQHPEPIYPVILKTHLATIMNKEYPAEMQEVNLGLDY